MHTIFKVVGVAGLLLAAWSASGQNRWYVEGKLENQEAYATLVWHGLIDRTESHIPAWSQSFWRTDVRIDETDGANGDKLTIVSLGRNSVAPHLGEPPVGQNFNFGAHFTTSKPGVDLFRAFQSDLHGVVHLDFQFAAAAVDFKGKDINEYVFIGGGVHISDGNWQKLIERLGKAVAEQVVPPGVSDAKAMSVIVSAENGQTMLVIAVRGIFPESMLTADLRLGARGDVGTPVLDLGPPDAWVRTEVGMMRMINWNDFPSDLRGPLDKGLLSVNISTWLYPQGEVRGQLERPKTPLPFVGPHG